MFQNQVNYKQAPGIVGGIASMNPIATVDAGPGGLTAGPNGILVGRFAWNSYPVAGGPGRASNACPAGQPRKPDGFISNLQQGLITSWLTNSTLAIPSGKGVTEHLRGDFWAFSTMSEALINSKVFANLLDGQVLAAAAGSFPTNAAGTVSSVTASLVVGTNTMTISATGSGIPAIGQLVTGPGVAPNTYIESIGTYNGTSGTVFLSQNALATETAQAYTTALPEAYGGFVGTASFATNVMTVTAITSGALAVGQLVQSANVAAGTYIASLGTGTGGLGTYNLSTAPGTISAQAASTSAWIETDWYVNSPGNVMDLIKIGVR
jgi:hypothetical protein